MYATTSPDFSKDRRVVARLPLEAGQAEPNNSMSQPQGEALDNSVDNRVDSSVPVVEGEIK